MTGLLQAIKTKLSSVIPTTPYYYGTQRPTAYPYVTAMETELAGETSYQTGGVDIQRIIIRFSAWDLTRQSANLLADLMTDAFSSTSPAWRPVWSGGQLIDAYQSGVTTTNESDQVDSNNRVIWVSESVIEFLVTRE